MIVLWLSTGLLGQTGQEQPQQQVSAGDWGSYRRPKKKREDREEIERQEALRIEAERLAAEELATFEEEERKRYLKRLDDLLSIQPVVFDATPIADAAQRAVDALFTEIAQEFDRYVAQLERDRDDEEAVLILLLAA